MLHGICEWNINVKMKKRKQRREAGRDMSRKAAERKRHTEEQTEKGSVVKKTETRLLEAKAEYGAIWQRNDLIKRATCWNESMLLLKDRRQNLWGNNDRMTVYEEEKWQCSLIFWRPVAEEKANIFNEESKPIQQQTISVNHYMEKDLWRRRRKVAKNMKYDNVLVSRLRKENWQWENIIVTMKRRKEKTLNEAYYYNGKEYEAKMWWQYQAQKEKQIANMNEIYEEDCINGWRLAGQRGEENMAGTWRIAAVAGQHQQWGMGSWQLNKWKRKQVKMRKMK